ncbi:MAG: glycosyltransferase family 39 protein [Pseudomonadota bacterium]
MTAIGMRLPRGVVLTVCALVLLRLVAATFTPLTFDEAYYWTWSKSLAGGYYDHPPMVAVVIRLGTMIGGDTAFGVRLVSILLALPMSWAVYRTAEILFGDVRIAAASAILLNATLMVAAGTVIVTPDAPLIVAASFVLYFLAKVLQTGRGLWWIAVGAAVGCGLLSKYTAFFFGLEILLWLLLVKDQRRWLASPWPYFGGVVAFAIFSPVILWNAEHEWASFLKQFGRARIQSFTPQFVAELIPVQFFFATPSVFVLGVMGLYALLTRNTVSAAERGLINASFWTIVVYFAWHSLHERVEGNWLGPVYPAFAIAAAYAAHGRTWDGRGQRIADLSRRWAMPVSVVLFVLLILQANTGILSGFRRDPTARNVGVGWPALAKEIEAIRLTTDATCILLDDYGTTAWLKFYLPKGNCVAQRADRLRWINAPEPGEMLLRGKVLLVAGPGAPASLRDGFARVEKVADVARRRSGVAVGTYEVYLLENATGDVLFR